MTDEAAFLKIPARNVKMEPEVKGCFTSLVSMSLRTSNEDDSDLIVGTSENFGIFNVDSNQIHKKRERPTNAVQNMQNGNNEN